MATATTTIYIGGTKLLPYHVHVEQRSDWHHRFEITVSTEKAGVMGGAIKAPESVVIENAIAYAGETAEITIERPNGTFNFKGYVTDVQVDQTYAGNAFIIFKGYSPTYLLEGQKSVASFEEKTLEDIFNEVTADFPGNIPKEIKPHFTKPIPYVVRYKETQYQFLSRMAATYGEWFYYDGQKIVFGELPAQNPKVKLTFGSDSMLSFNYGINVRPTTFKQQAYRYQDNAPVEQSVAGFEPGWLDAHSQIAHKVSKDLFVEEGQDPVSTDIKDSSHIKYLAEAKKSSILSDTMLFNGQSADPGITIGAEIKVYTKKDSLLGEYRVISVTHSFNSNRDYYNVFRAIPLKVLSPPSNKGVLMPEAEPQVGEVVENNDPEQLGRVRVKLKWQEGMTPWIRVLTNYAGSGKAEGITGTYFIPEIGDEVFVEFEQGNPARPYVVGSNYHGKTKPDFADANNNMKAIKTRSGHKIVFNDAEGGESIIIEDKNGNWIFIDTANNNITVSANETMTFTAKNIKIKAEENIDMVAGKDFTKSIGENYNVMTKNNTLIVEENLSTDSKKQQNVADEIIMSSNKQNLTLSSGKTVDIQSKEKVKLF